MSVTLKLCGQIILLSVVYWGCKYFVEYTGFPVPANVLGIVVLFLLMLFGIIKEEWISLAAGFLLKHLVFFFIPIAVALMNWGTVFYEYGWVLLAAIVISSFVPLWGVALLVTFLGKENKECRKK